VSDLKPAPALPEHYFRHESGRLVSVLSRRFGMHRVELCEDAVQTALLRAVESWPRQGLPDDKSAWLYRVAFNEVLSALRRAKRTDTSVDATEHLAAEASTEEAVYLEHEVRDDQLRMLFVCATPEIPRESQIVFALKILCAFSVEEIALRLFQSPEAIYKRLQRARAVLRGRLQELESPGTEELASRRSAVLEILYLLFTEGYSSAQPDKIIRHELCEEAIRLGLLLDGHPVCAALGSRRSLHAEAAIAAEHCLAPTYPETRWDEIARLYRMLDDVAPSPINTLNRAIAMAEWKGPDSRGAGASPKAAGSPVCQTGRVRLLPQPLERLQGEHHFDRDVEVSRDAKRQVQGRTVLSAFEVADGLVVHAERFGQLAPRDAAFCAQHRHTVVDDVAGFPHDQ
jgi:RNA polymerase sigma factor (sigma-70 family)